MAQFSHFPPEKFGLHSHSSLRLHLVDPILLHSHARMIKVLVVIGNVLKKYMLKPVHIHTLLVCSIL